MGLSRATGMDERFIAPSAAAAFAPNESTKRPKGHVRLMRLHCIAVVGSL